MKLKKIIRELSLKVKTAPVNPDNEVTGGYAGDLLSDVLANSKTGNIWVTMQTHQNVVAVASMKSLSGIVLVNSREPDAETIKKAEAEKIPIMTSRLPAFELIGKLYALGVYGKG